MRFDNHPLHKILVDKGCSLKKKLDLNEVDRIIRSVDVSSVVALIAEDELAYSFDREVAADYPRSIWKDLSPAIKKSIAFIYGRHAVINQLAEVVKNYKYSSEVITAFLLQELERLHFILGFCCKFQRMLSNFYLIYQGKISETERIFFLLKILTRD